MNQMHDYTESSAGNDGTGFGCAEMAIALVGGLALTMAGIVVILLA